MENEKLKHALTLAHFHLKQAGRGEEAEMMLHLRNSIINNGTPSVWSNRKAFRRFQGQNDNNSKSPKDGFKKYHVIMLEDK